MIDQSEPALPRILSLMDDFPIIPGPFGSAGTGRRMLRYPDASKRAASCILPASVHEPRTFFLLIIIIFNFVLRDIQRVHNK